MTTLRTVSLETDNCESMMSRFLGQREPAYYIVED